MRRTSNLSSLPKSIDRRRILKPPFARIVELAKTRIPKRFGLDPIRDIQVLCPMNRGGVGARSLNIELQAVLNPAGDEKVRALWLDLCGRRQGDADRERLRQGGLQR